MTLHSRAHARNATTIRVVRDERCSDGAEGHTRAENVGAVAGRMHPSRVDRRGIFSDGNVLGNVGEPRAGVGEPLLQSRLAGELMLGSIEVEHEQGMLPRRFEERVVPLQFWKMICGALVIEQVQQLALGFVALERLRLRTARCRNEKPRDCG